MIRLERSNNMLNTNVADNVNEGFFCLHCLQTPDELADIQNKEEEEFGEAVTMECCTPELIEEAYPAEEYVETSAEETPETLVEDVPVIQEQKEKVTMTEDEVTQKIAELMAQLQQLTAAATAAKVKEVNDSVKKNHKPGKPAAGRKYILLTDKLEMWGRVPRQQEDIAKILVRSMEVGKEYEESEVFNSLIDQCGEFPSLCNSKQDVTYLFKYYRGLKKDDKHAGFFGRNFLKQIN